MISVKNIFFPILFLSVFKVYVGKNCPRTMGFGEKSPTNIPSTRCTREIIFFIQSIYFYSIILYFIKSK